MNKVTRAGIGILVLKDNKVLLGLRHEDPEKASSELNGEGTWTMPGGKIDFGETFLQAASRELKEETDIDTKIEDFDVIHIRDNMVPTAHFLTVGLLLKNPTQEPKVMEPDEITEWKWFDLNNVPENIFLPSKHVLEGYLSKTLFPKI